MKTYRTAMTVFGLSAGSEFSSDDPRWDNYVKGGVLVLVSEEPAEDVLYFDDEENEE